MKLQVGDYTIEGSSYNWNLIKREKYTNDKGEEKVRTETWYYPKIEQALNTLVDERLKDVQENCNLKENVGEVLLSLSTLKEEILGAIKN